MLFKKDSSKTPAAIKGLGLETWYSSLDEKNVMKLSRYIEKADISSKFVFFTSVAEAALADDNPRFAVFMCQQSYEVVDMTDYETFQMNEILIDAYIGAARYDDAKAACNANLEAYPKIKDQLLADNGGAVPKKLNFRNRYIDVVVGVESAYDHAFEMLEKYYEMGLIDAEELEYRRNSLKTHRLQRLFDGVYTYRPTGEDR